MDHFGRGENLRFRVVGSRHRGQGLGLMRSSDFGSVRQVPHVPGVDDADHRLMKSYEHHRVMTSYDFGSVWQVPHVPGVDDADHRALPCRGALVPRGGRSVSG
jgi:hypothetical protein